MLLAPQFSAAMSHVYVCVFWSFNFLLPYISCTYSVQCCFLITFSHMYIFVFGVCWPSSPSLVTDSLLLPNGSLLYNTFMFLCVNQWLPSGLLTEAWAIHQWLCHWRKSLQKQQLTADYVASCGSREVWTFIYLKWGLKTKEVKIDLSTWLRARGPSRLAPARTELGLYDISSFLFIDSPNLPVVLSSFWLLSIKSRWPGNPIDLTATCREAHAVARLWVRFCHQSPAGFKFQLCRFPAGWFWAN